jgi:hypothetical protein
MFNFVEKGCQDATGDVRNTVGSPTCPLKAGLRRSNPKGSGSPRSDGTVLEGENVHIHKVMGDFADVSIHHESQATGAFQRDHGMD